MAVLVTGGAGYIGSHMVLELVDAGEKVVVLDNLSTGFRWAVDPRAELVICDIGDQNLIRTLIKKHGILIKKHGIAAIIHFAGSIVVPDSVADPLGYYNNNTVKSRAAHRASSIAAIRRDTRCCK
jgi:UDP-glucose 4-epimerase